MPQEDVKARRCSCSRSSPPIPTPIGRPRYAGRRTRSGRPHPGFTSRLLRLIDGAVSRIQLQQSVALPTEEAPRQAWQIDLPVQLQDGTEDVMLRIERDDGDTGDGDGNGWSVNLAFEFDTIGTLQCRIGLSGDRVATTFWCDNATTHARMEQRLPTLRQALEAQGLEVTHLEGVLGDPVNLIRVRCRTACWTSERDMKRSGKVVAGQHDIAIALTYDGDNALRVTAKGEHLLADRIVEAAEEAGALVPGCRAGDGACPGADGRRDTRQPLQGRRRGHRVRLHPGRQVSGGFPPRRRRGDDGRNTSRQMTALCR